MEERIKKLEEGANLLYKIEAKIDVIEKYVIEAINNGKTTIKHEQQIISLEKRVKNSEDRQDDLRKEIASINLKIALASGAYGVIIFIINKIL